MDTDKQEQITIKVTMKLLKNLTVTAQQTFTITFPSGETFLYILLPMMNMINDIIIKTAGTPNARK